MEKFSSSRLCYIEQQLPNSGHSTISGYISDLIYQDQQRKSQEQLEAQILEGLDSGAATPLTSTDWAEIRQAVRHNITNTQP